MVAGGTCRLQHARSCIWPPPHHQRSVTARNDALAGWPAPADLLPPLCPLQLWHRSNWHWYLKLELGYDARPGRACSSADILLAWDDQVAGRLHCLVHSSLYQRLDLAWCKQVGALHQHMCFVWMIGCAVL